MPILQICSSLTPCADFYFCSKAKLSSDDTLGKTAGEFSDLKCAIQIGLTLVIIWKVSYNCQHIFLTHIGKPFMMFRMYEHTLMFCFLQSCLIIGTC